MSFDPYNNAQEYRAGLIIPNLEMRKGRFSDSEWFVQSHVFGPGNKLRFFEIYFVY